MRNILIGIYEALRDHGPSGWRWEHSFSPSGLPLPFGRYRITSGAPAERTTGLYQVMEYNLNLQLWHTIDEDIASAIDDLLQLFYGPECFTYTDGEVLDAYAVNMTIDTDPDKTPEGGDVWMGQLSFEIKVQEKPGQ